MSNSSAPPLPRSSARSLLRNWWPALLWIALLFAESTAFASAENTSGLLYKILSFVSPHIDRSFVEVLDAILRKTGHFLGYGILSVLVFLALRNTNRDRLPLPTGSWGKSLPDRWRAQWSWIGVAAAIVMATYDEIHQSFIPSRTGRWQDVVLDTCGALAMQFVLYLLAVRALRRCASIDVSS